MSRSNSPEMVMAGPVSKPKNNSLPEDSRFDMDRHGVEVLLMAIEAVEAASPAHSGGPNDTNPTEQRTASSNYLGLDMLVTAIDQIEAQDRAPSAPPDNPRPTIQPSPSTDAYGLDLLVRAAQEIEKRQTPAPASPVSIVASADFDSSADSSSENDGDDSDRFDDILLQVAIDSGALRKGTASMIAAALRNPDSAIERNWLRNVREMVLPTLREDAEIVQAAERAMESGRRETVVWNARRRRNRANGDRQQQEQEKDEAEGSRDEMQEQDCEMEEAEEQEHETDEAEDSEDEAPDGGDEPLNPGRRCRQESESSDEGEKVRPKKRSRKGKESVCDRGNGTSSNQQAPTSKEGEAGPSNMYAHNALIPHRPLLRLIVRPPPPPPSPVDGLSLSNLETLGLAISKSAHPLRNEVLLPVKRKDRGEPSKPPNTERKRKARRKADSPLPAPSSSSSLSSSSSAPSPTFSHTSSSPPPSLPGPQLIPSEPIWNEPPVLPERRPAALTDKTVIGAWDRKGAGCRGLSKPTSRELRDIRREMEHMHRKPRAMSTAEIWNMIGKEWSKVNSHVAKRTV